MLVNYKIRVNNEAESTEAQELFEQLGFEKTGFSCGEFPYYLATWEGGFSDYPLDSLNVSRARKEITLTQLRDLVTKSKKEKGLISGVDALRALADGKEVEFKDGMDKWENIKHHMNLDLSMFLKAPDWMKFRLKPRTILITLSLEIPAPFDPKDGDEVYFIDCDTTRGYSSDIIGQGCDPDWIQFGAWKSEDEIKQVVAALRSTLTTK